MLHSPGHRQYHDMKAVRQHRSTEDRISVLQFTNSMLWGGVEEHICNLLGNISRELFRAHLVCDPVLFERFRNAIPDEIDITPLAFSSPRHLASAVRFARLLFRERVRIVHSHMFWSSLFASPIAWAGRVPVIVETLHGTEAWRTGWKASCLVDRATTGFVSKYVAVCQSDAQFLQHKKHILPKKIAIIHNGVDGRRFCTAQDARNAIRRSLGFTEADLVVIMVARFHRGKGHAILLNAIRELRPVCPLLKVVCLGEGEDERELQALTEKYGIADCVRLVGYQQNVPEWLAAADINVLPSFYEGLPLTVLEAMASALPTVATNVGGIPEAIENGVSGLLVPAGDVRALVEALSLLLRDPARRAQIGHAARERLLRSFVLEQQVVQTEKMYLDLCGACSGQPVQPRSSDVLTAVEASLPNSSAGPELEIPFAQVEQVYNTHSS
jgi:glycosyltransferase involved in cell wall biosynthesis